MKKFRTPKCTSPVCGILTSGVALTALVILILASVYAMFDKAPRRGEGYYNPQPTQFQGPSYGNIKQQVVSLDQQKEWSKNNVDGVAKVSARSDYANFEGFCDMGTCPL